MTLKLPARNHAGTMKSGARVTVSIRPEQLSMVRMSDDFSPDSALSEKITVLNRIFLGEQTEYLVRNDQLGEFLVLSPRRSELSVKPFDVGETAFVACSRETILILEN